jgi:DNA invertase Pin-like site-specific DNA recombinase
MSRTAVYVRISHDPAGERAGVERQRKECFELVERYGWGPVEVYEDNDVSAYSRRPRPEFERLLENVQNGHVTRLVVWATDRLYRRVSDLVRITDVLAGCEVRSVVGGEIDLSTAEGRFRAQMLGAVGEFESARRGERVKARARQRAEEGRVTAGSRPFGWQSAGKYFVPHSVEALLLEQAYGMFLGGASLNSICRWIEEQGTTGTRGTPLRPTQLRKILVSPRNAGIVTYRGVEIGRNDAQIIDVDTWRATCNIISDPSRRTSTGRKSNALLVGRIRCGNCGGPMASSNRNGRVPEYRCTRGGNGCPARRRELVDGPIIETVRLVVAELAKHDIEPAPIGAGESQIRNLEEKAEQLAALFNDGLLDPIDFARAVAPIREQIKELSLAVTSKPALNLFEVDDRKLVHSVIRKVTILRPAVPRHPTEGDVTIEWSPWLTFAQGLPSAPAHTPAVTPAQRAAHIVRLTEKGLNIAEISRATGYCRETVKKVQLNAK